MKPELLSPAGNWISLRAAIKAGADAVYFGIKELNMRANAKNFELRKINKITKLCHDNNVKAYLTLNTIVYENELNKIEKILKKAKEAEIDAIIAWDFSVLKLCRELKLRIHLSTQASVSNYSAAEYYYRKFGISRIVLARECTLDDIKGIIRKIKRNKLDLEIETFIHGAMCVSISGRCFLSQSLFNKSANRGECLQPCRRKYLIKDVEEGHEFELGEDYIISPKDLCTIEIIDKLIEAKIDAFKIEGRNRSPEYVKVTTECYREMIDTLSQSKITGGWGTSTKKGKRQNIVSPGVKNKLKNKLIKKLKTVYNRGFSTGFFLGKPLNEWSKVYGSKATKKKIYLGKVLNYYKKVKVAEILLETNNLRLNDKIMFQGNKTGVIEQKVTSMEIENKKMTKTKKGQRVGIKTDEIVRENDKVFLTR